MTRLPIRDNTKAHPSIIVAHVNMYKLSVAFDPFLNSAKAENPPHHFACM